MCKEWELPSFDALAAFSQNDPIGYERYRVQMLNAQVALAPPERRPALQHLLHSLEVARQGASTPLEAAAIANTLMCKSLNELGQAWHQLQWLGAELQTLRLIESAKGRM